MIRSRNSGSGVHISKFCLIELVDEDSIESFQMGFIWRCLQLTHYVHFATQTSQSHFRRDPASIVGGDCTSSDKKSSSVCVVFNVGSAEQIETQEFLSL